MNMARFSPLAQRKHRRLTLRSEFGEVKLVVDYGQHPENSKWLCPIQQHWGLRAHQKITPGFAEKLCFTVTATGSYEEAAQVASKWAPSIDDATLHALVQRVGRRAEAQAQRRYEQPPQERLPQRGPSGLGVLMVDGCQIRYRGAGWGKKKTKKERVEWHELKLGVFYGQEQCAHTEAGRGILTDKVVVTGRTSRPNWGGGSTGKLCAKAWGEPGRPFTWAMEPNGYGISNKIAGRMRWNFWIFIMAVNTCGI